MQLPEDRPDTIFAEVMDRSGFAGGTLALRAGMVGELPLHRCRPTPTMMGVGRDHGAMLDAAVRDRILAAETQP